MPRSIAPLRLAPSKNYFVVKLVAMDIEISTLTVPAASANALGPSFQAKSASSHVAATRLSAP